jgi:PKD domain
LSISTEALHCGINFANRLPSQNGKALGTAIIFDLPNTINSGEQGMNKIAIMIGLCILTGFSFYAADTYIIKRFDFGNKSAFAAPYSTDVPAGKRWSNTLPTPRINVSNSAGEAPHFVVEFSAAESADSDGTIISYVWNFGDGDMATTAITNHAYPSAGTFTATLVVTDNEGGVATAHTTIAVSMPVAKPSPIAVSHKSPMLSQAFPL